MSDLTNLTETAYSVVTTRSQARQCTPAPPLASLSQRDESLTSLHPIVAWFLPILASSLTVICSRRQAYATTTLIVASTSHVVSSFHGGEICLETSRCH